MVDVTALCCGDEGEQRSMSSDDPACFSKKKDFNMVNRISVDMYVTHRTTGDTTRESTTTEQPRNNYGTTEEEALTPEARTWHRSGHRW